MNKETYNWDTQDIKVAETTKPTQPQTPAQEAFVVPNFDGPAQVVTTNFNQAKAQEKKEQPAKEIDPYADAFEAIEALNASGQAKFQGSTSITDGRYWVNIVKCYINLNDNNKHQFVIETKILSSHAKKETTSELTGTTKTNWVAVLGKAEKTKHAGKIERIKFYPLPSKVFDTPEDKLEYIAKTYSDIAKVFQHSPVLIEAATKYNEAIVEGSGVEQVKPIEYAFNWVKTQISNYVNAGRKGKEFLDPKFGYIIDVESLKINQLPFTVNKYSYEPKDKPGTTNSKAQLYYLVEKEPLV